MPEECLTWRPRCRPRNEWSASYATPTDAPFAAASPPCAAACWLQRRRPPACVVPAAEHGSGRSTSDAPAPASPKSSPRSQCHSFSPPMPPHAACNCSRSSASSCSMVRIPALLQPLLHARADAWQVAWRQRGQGVMQHVRRQGYQAVRLFHVGRYFGQVPVGRQANRAAKRGSRPCGGPRL